MDIEGKGKSRKRQIKKSQVVFKYVCAILALFVVLIFTIKLFEKKIDVNIIESSIVSEVENLNSLNEEGTKKIDDKNFEKDENTYENVDLNSETIKDTEKVNIESNEYLENMDLLATNSEIIFHRDNLLFVGDIAINKKNVNAYRSSKGIELIVDKTYRKYIAEKDLLIGNMECVLSDKGEPVMKQFNFRASPSMVNMLKDLDFDILSVANNHSLDFGEVAFLDMLDTFKKNDISYIGGGKNSDEAYAECIKEVNGAKYAFLAATVVAPYGSWFAGDDSVGLSNGYNNGRINKRIRELKKEVDKVIVYMHWGREKEEIANETQMSIGRAFVNAGADLVLGCHSHTLQNIEFYKSTPIIYGLGNFIFGGTWTDTMMVSVDFIYSNLYPKGRINLKIIPGISGYELTKVYWKKEDIDAMLYNILVKSPTATIDENGYIIEKLENVENTENTENIENIAKNP